MHLSGYIICFVYRKKKWGKRMFQKKCGGVSHAFLCVILSWMAMAPVGKCCQHDGWDVLRACQESEVPNVAR